MRKISFLLGMASVLLIAYTLPVTTDNEAGIGFNYHQQSIIFDDFISWGNAQDSGQTGWTTYCSGTGSATTTAGANINERNRPGIRTIYSGNATTSYACYEKDNDSVYLGGTGNTSVPSASSGTGQIFGEVFYETAFRLDVLSDGTDTYTAAVGLTGDLDCDTAPDNRVWISYTHGTDSGKFQCQTSTLVSTVLTTTTISSGITVEADKWYDLIIDVSTDANSVSFYINDPNTPVCTITTNIPSTQDSGAQLTPVYLMKNSAGTDTDRKMYVDYSFLKQNFGDVR